MFNKSGGALPIVLCLVASLANAQSVTPSVSNILRYGNGERGTAGFSQPFTYFENLTDVRLNVQPSVTVGFRLLVDDPPEIGERFQGFKRRFIEYRDENFMLRAGNFNELFGRGLALNLFENRGLAYDSWMDGVKAQYQSSSVSATIIGGTLDFRDSVIITRHERYSIRGANVELKPVKGIVVGTSFIETKGTLPQFVGSKEIAAEIPEVYSAVRFGPFHGFIGYAHKWTNVVTDTVSQKGYGIYGSLSYNGKGFGITAEYKDYRFDIRDPFDRGASERATRMLPLQNPPIVQKEHNYTLLTRAIHQIDFSDEVGLQVEGFYSPSSSTTLNVNASVASRHHYYDYNTASFSFAERKRDNSLLPSLERQLSPYWEFFAEGEHYYEERSAIRIGFARRANVLYNDFTGAQFSHTQQATIIPLQIQHGLTEAYSVIVHSEHEFAYDSYNSSNEHFYTQMLTIIVTRSPDFSFSARYEHTTDTADPSGRRDWFVGEIGYTFGQSHTTTVSYGRERGGQVCSNGVCQYQLPFEGVRFTLRSII
ncbi:MAG: hypothetical protein HYV29_00720 [Ignavibacteriales bacterium]|nr:hypothetical protein [Ignavibacteriales bacterium]